MTRCWWREQGRAAADAVSVYAVAVHPGPFPHYVGRGGTSGVEGNVLAGQFSLRPDGHALRIFSSARRRCWNPIVCSP